MHTHYYIVCMCYFLQVVVATIVSSYVMFESRFDVTVVGTIPKG